MSFRFRYWVWTGFWAALVMASMAFMLMGLWRRIFFGYTPIPEFVEDLRVGNQFLLAGSGFSVAAAVQAWVQRYPRWVAACVAAPAVMIGGVALVTYPNLAPHLAAVFALPVAVAGLLGGILRWHQPGDE